VVESMLRAIGICIFKLSLSSKDNYPKSPSSELPTHSTKSMEYLRKYIPLFKKQLSTCFENRSDSYKLQLNGMKILQVF
jgi:hypothetical protein